MTTISRSAAALALLACALPAQAKPARFKVIHVADLAKALESKNPPMVYDANVDSVRENVGTVPGARLLSSSSKYDVAKELPADKKTPLVFYCANPMCTASHSAAEKAIDAGYSDVSVMVDGIFGWRKAGLAREPVPGAPKSMAPKDAAALVREAGAVIVDVREAEERFTVVPGARWIAMTRVGDEKEWAGFVAGLPQGRTVVFHCASGKRAKRAAEKLSAQGFKTAYFESPDQWKAAGLPVEKGPAD